MIAPRSSTVTLVALGLLLPGAGAATAGPLELGGLIGPRRFSPGSALGEHEPPQTSLGNTVVLGARVGKPVTSWLAFEGELAFTPGSTRDYDIGVFWLEPRVQLRLQVPAGRVRPFLVLGAGGPAALSQASSVYPSGISVEGYGGLGAAFRPGRGVGLRLDVRVGVLPARESNEYEVTVEGEVTAGLWFELGRKRAAVAAPVVVATPTDGDGDGVIDERDACVDRAEDVDQFEDDDGCPDIDNDGDLVLDIADACDAEPESYNGLDDDDGCPDSLGADVDAILGTVEGLNYEPGQKGLDAEALPAVERIAKVLAAHPAVRVVIVGHTDDVEASDLVPPPAEGEPPPDLEPAMIALGEARAAAVRDALIARGVGRTRVVVSSVGASEPLSDDLPRGRRVNRRVELKLYVPKRER